MAKLAIILQIPKRKNEKSILHARLFLWFPYLKFARVAKICYICEADKPLSQFMEKKILYPVDTASFSNIRENGFVYVDKTGYIHVLTESNGRYFFLARPRRFGKSLFLDTLAEYFLGNRDLFKGLAIDSLQPQEWKSYPVLRINLTGKDYADSNSLIIHLKSQLNRLEKETSLEEDSNEFEGKFTSLIQRISEKSGKKVVILIDEYDAPLSSAIDNPELQEKYRGQLHGFYSVLKASEEYIQFCFLTGVTRYGKVSIFSGLNNLRDITFLDEYAGICGVTNEELRRYYSEGVGNFAASKGVSPEEIFELLKFHYDGYHFSESMLDIYNPFSLNHAMANQKIDNYWCRSGVPTILSKSLMEDDFRVETLNGIRVDSDALSDLSMYLMNPIPLFYQTGYITLKSYNSKRQLFTLGYPNREVETGILRNILKFYTGYKKSDRVLVYDMEDALEDGNPEEFLKILKSFLADIPSQLHKYVSRYENYYHTVFYCLTTLIGLDVEAEYSTSEGFIDMLIKTAGYIYIIELKVNGTAEDAMAQIDEKHYAAPFAADSRKVVKIGIGFSSETHNIASSLIR